MKISVIIPALNEAGHIGETIRYIQQHGGGRLAEILVVDGGSQDDTIRLAEAAGGAVLLAPEKGRGAQMDFGARQSTGEVLYFVHADTLPPEKQGMISRCCPVNAKFRPENMRPTAGCAYSSPI